MYQYYSIINIRDVFVLFSVCVLRHAAASWVDRIVPMLRSSAPCSSPEIFALLMNQFYVYPKFTGTQDAR